MNDNILLALAFVGAIVGAVLGYFARIAITLGKRGSIELQIKQMMLEAREEAKKIVFEAEQKATEVLKESRDEIKEREAVIKRTEERLIKKEEFLDKRQTDIDKDVEELKQKVTEIKAIKERADALEEEREKALEKTAALTREEAKQELLHTIEKEHDEDLLVRLQKLELVGSEKLEQKAREILTTTIQRLSSSVASDVMSTAVQIPSEDIKGKIIGKEGRNIKAFERATGVELVVDDTPGSIMISSFNPVRRQIARIALENLVADGRIQPARIEEFVKKAEEEVNRTIKERGEAAVYECGVFNLDPRLVSILGRLYFRTSYGQNVLQHSMEVAHIAGMLATELGANVAVAKTGALLHDIGKALDHEVQGTHVEIGRRILQKFNVSEDVIKAMQAHHGEYPFETLESIIVQTADAISGSRPGARRDSIENYIKRLEDLEGIANSFPGIEKSYAIAAGREIRVFVKPEEISDMDAVKLAREIASRVEQELKYPGEIKVTIIRESRTVDFAR
jgi:ribonucrease Y